MSGEITIRASLQIRSGFLQYQSSPTGFQADLEQVTPAKGPTPGVLAVSLAGVNVDLSQIGTPGWAFLYNLGTGDDTLDETAFVVIGPFDPTTAVHEFLPMLELLPGQGYPVLLSRYLGQEFGTTTGTGTTGQNTVLRLKAVGAAQTVLVEAFQR